MTTPHIFARLSEADAAVLVDLRRQTREGIRIEAARRHQSPEALVAQLLDSIERADQFAAVLEAGRVGV